MIIYATTDDVIKFRGPQETSTLTRLTEILPSCSASLRRYATMAGIDLNALVEDDEDVKELTKKAVVDASFYYLSSLSQNETLLSQFTQSAGGYSLTGTLANVGGGFYFPKSVLRTLGIVRPKVSSFEVFKYD